MSGGDDDDRWRAGHRLLVARAALLPEALVRTCALPPPDLNGALGSTPVVTTGIGSSEAHARYLAYLLTEHAGRPARFLPLSALASGAGGDVLVVFTQGLSPNAQLALAHAARWRCVIVATAVTRPEALADLRARGIRVAGFAGEDEFGTLLRLVGPLCGYACALRLAGALGAPIPLDPERLAAAVAAGLSSSLTAVAGIDVATLDPPLAFLVSGAYGELVRNLQLKVLEGMLQPLPPAWDLLHVAHGPYQQAVDGPATFLALTRADAIDEPALLARLEAMLDHGRHRLLRLHATLPGPLAIFEHEAQMNALVLHAMARRAVDQAGWPGRGRDGPLYALAAPPVERRLAALTWPEVAMLIARGHRTAVVPLGSIEQHGHHLPLATDAWIGDALGERFCAQVDEAVLCPTLHLGCASEHLGFPGTLHVEAETLEATLRDLVAALARHGFERVFVFSAHGGNASLLEAALPRLRAGAPIAVLGLADHGRVAAALQATATEAGVPPAIAGHHAGEVETSILLALRPGLVRRAQLRAGVLTDAPNPQELFYPDLRQQAAEGVVGDPRPADATRGMRYLDAWVALLVDAYRREKNSVHTTGTQPT